ncbi:MAG: hypothetical protein KAH12_12470, partial [Anaerolineales bacterium]|nr:hypothetical protein [Anaerolineales bacterium]
MQEALNQILQTVGAYVPNLVGALLILIVGWLIALIVSAGVSGVLRRTKLADKVSGAFGEGQEEKMQDAAKGAGKAAFWVIMIFVLIGFFQALRLTLVTDPLNRLMNQVFQFLPQLFGAGILLLIAWVIATVLRLIITRVMGAAKLDERIGGQV